MHAPTLLAVLFTTLLPSVALARDDDPASQDGAKSVAEEVCYEKTWTTGSGAAAAIKGFCSQVENKDDDNDNPNASAEVALNGYTAGGFEPSGIMTTARLIAKKKCATDLGGEEGCLSGFYEACATGDQFGKGSAKKDCLEFNIS